MQSRLLQSLTLDGPAPDAPARPVASVRRLIGPSSLLLLGWLAGLLATPLILTAVSPAPVAVAWVPLAVVTTVLLAFTLVGPSWSRAVRLVGGALIVGAVGCLWLLATSGLPDRPYGDGAILARFVADGRAMPRWLLGSALTASLHALVWQSPPVVAWLPESLRSASAFLSLLCTVVTLGGTWALWRRWPGQLSVVLPVLTPIWLLFASGYVEYYPLIASGFVAALAWLFERPLGDRSPVAIGVLCGLLPVVYLGFLPTAVTVAVMWAVSRRRDVGLALAVGVGAAWLAVGTCWPEGPISFSRTLHTVLNVGDAHLHPRYLGAVAGAASPMFSTSYALSPRHLREVGYLMAWGGGWWTWALLAAAAVLAVRRRAPGTWREPRVWLGLLLVAWHAYYLVFMIPRLGLPEDVDLFFSVYLLAAFLAGHLLDRIGVTREPRLVAALLVLAGTGLAGTAPALLWYGLPPGP